MTMFTDLPCVQLYTGNHLPTPAASKRGGAYVRHAGLCLETQTCPNAAEMPWLISPIYPAGQEYISTTAYQFSTTE
jgi:aldose 1-epimerase